MSDVRTESADEQAPVDRFCDLVMKGGTTSGIVYPKAVALLSRHYRFKNIGGSSAGAIAAAVTAAAEFQRWSGSSEGFALLEQLPEELQRSLPDGRSKLLSLFQPQRGTRRLFSVLISALNRGGTWRRVFWTLLGVLAAYWPAVLTGVVAAAAVAWLGGDALATALMFVLTTLLSLGLLVYYDATRAVPANGFGLCSGMTEDSAPEALTPWLHRTIQKAAGLPQDAPPLTFGQLWSADKPALGSRHARTGKKRCINLQMFTTNLSHGRPYILPLDSTAEVAGSRLRVRERLYWLPDELRRYFPADVLNWMVEHSDPYSVERGREGKDPPLGKVPDSLREFPAAEDLPVLVAARMSLSFPLLFSAVPLWAIDHDMPKEHRVVRRCWFSDGGICSNFPIHLFDSFLPRWPTFGISLENKVPHRKNMVYLPDKYEDGHGERWKRFDEEERSASRFGGFLASLVSTMKDWNDNALSRMPGVRDRVARVRLEAHEGGMNLNMQRKDMSVIAQRGADAAQALASRFCQVPAEEGPLSGWDEHRWVRMQVLVKSLEARASSFAPESLSSGAYANSYEDLIARAVACGETALQPGFDQAFTEEQGAHLRRVLQELEELMSALTEAPISNPFRPVPVPEIRVRPPL